MGRGIDISNDIVSRVTSIIDIPLNKIINYDYTGTPVAGLPIYIGIGDINALESDDNWVIIKHAYDGSGNITKKQSLSGRWDGRTGLSWSS